MIRNAFRATRPASSALVAFFALSLLGPGPAAATPFRQSTANFLPDGVGLQPIRVTGADPALDGTTAWVTGAVTTLVHSTPFVLVNSDVFVGRVGLSAGGLVVSNAIETKVNLDASRFDDSGADIVALSGGDAILAGTTYTASPDGDGVVVMRVDAGCAPVWSKVWGSAGIEQARHLVETADGGVLIGAITTGFVPGFDFDLLLLKVSAGGALEWAKLYETSLEEQCGSLIRTADDNYVITGSTGSLTDNRAFLMKIDGTGAILWAKTYASTCNGEAVIEASNGDLVVGGTVFASGTDGYVLRTTSDGAPLWGRAVGRSGGSFGEGVFGLVESGAGFVAAGYATEVSMFAVNEPYVFRVGGTGTTVEYSVAADNPDTEACSIRDLIPLAGGELFAPGEWNGRRALTMRIDGADLACGEKDIVDAVSHFVRTDVTASVWSPTVSMPALTDYAHTRIETILATTDSTICSGGVTGIPESAGARGTVLQPAAPNPFADATVLSFSLDRPGTVSLDVYDVAGRRVRSLLRARPLGAGRHDVSLDASGLSGGIYFCELVTEGVRDRRKLTVRR